MNSVNVSPAVAIFHKRARSIYDGMKARAKELHIELPFDLDIFTMWLLDRFNSGPAGTTRCEYSGRVLSAEDFFVDHKTPISRKGSFWLDNLAICSEKENLRKGNMDAAEYRALQEFARCLPPEVEASIWRRLEVGDVQRHSYFRRKAKARKEVLFMKPQ
ncbi:MAG TPA: HNH endonuclease signature motif containing protein [Candidatus Angelobacter sp.]|nr:HNH endonuclease signature motif containing protein [Candidatus Angelobacter sp.]